MKVFGYVRVSTAKQREEGLSLEVQERKIRMMCELKGYELVEIFIDDGYSAKDLNRPAFQSMLTRLQANEAEGVVVQKIDRLTREMFDLTWLLKEVFNTKKKAKVLVSIEESLDSSTAIGEMMINMLGVFAQFERRVTGERTKKIMEHKKNKGEYTGGKAPLGWNKATDGELVPNEDEQNLIETIRDLRKRKITYAKIAKQFKEQGFKSRKGHSKWSISMIHRLDKATTVQEMEAKKEKMKIKKAVS